MSRKEHVLAGDLLQRYRDPSGDLRFIRRHDLDFLLRGLGVSVGSIRAKRSQFPCRDTKGRELAGRGGPPTAPIVRNKANFPRAGQHGRPCRYRWAKTCETKPIPPEHNKGQVLCGPRVMTYWTRKQPRPNKANPRPAPTGRVSAPNKANSRGQGEMMHLEQTIASREAAARRVGRKD
jgi:hypothetical protein